MSDPGARRPSSGAVQTGHGSAQASPATAGFSVTHASATDDTGLLPTAPGQVGHRRSPEHTPPSHHPWTDEFSPAGGYEIALDALLSLGEKKSETSTARGPTPATPRSAGGPPVDPEVTRGHTGSDTREISSVSGGLATHGLSESRILGLLRYYRYEVAPWVRETSIPFFCGSASSNMPSTARYLRPQPHVRHLRAMSNILLASHSQRSNRHDGSPSGTNRRSTTRQRRRQFSRWVGS